MESHNLLSHSSSTFLYNGADGSDQITEVKPSTHLTNIFTSR